MLLLQVTVRSKSGHQYSFQPMTLVFTKSTLDNSTAVAAGATLKFGKLTSMELLGTNSSRTATTKFC